jgi:EmrB/QacA subfamily drug resistance transporter
MPLHHHTNRRPAATTAVENVPRRVVLLAVLAVAQLMVILDISAVNVALPVLARDLGIARSDIGWAITSYSLVFGSLLLLGGRAADVIGRKRLFLSGLAVFTLASVVTALSGDPMSLFAARAGQGLGAAMLSPAALSVLLTAFRGAERTRALSVWGAVGGAGAALGVLLGGVLTEIIDWRAIFAINIPVGLALAVAALRVVPRDATRPQWRGLDLPGAVVATVGLGAIVFAISQASTVGWISAQTLGVGAAGLLALAAFIAVELRVGRPLVKVQRLADRAVGGGMVMMLAVSAVLFGSFLLTSIYLQEVLGASALMAGLAFLPMALAIGVGAHLGGRVIGRAGVRVPMAGALVVASAGLVWLSQVGVAGNYATDVLPGMVIIGIGLGVALVCVSAAVLTGAADHETGMLSGLNTTGHEIGGSLGVAALVSIATSAAAGTSTIGGIGAAFLTAAAIAVIAGMIAFVVLPAASTFLPALRLGPRVSLH